MLSISRWEAVPEGFRVCVSRGCGERWGQGPQPLTLLQASRPASTHGPAHCHYEGHFTCTTQSQPHSDGGRTAASCMSRTGTPPLICLGTQNKLVPRLALGCPRGPELVLRASPCPAHPFQGHQVRVSASARVVFSRTRALPRCRGRPCSLAPLLPVLVGALICPHGPRWRHQETALDLELQLTGGLSWAPGPTWRLRPQ